MFVSQSRHSFCKIDHEGCLVEERVEGLERGRRGMGSVFFECENENG